VERGPFVAIFERLDLRLVENDEGCVNSRYEPLRQHCGKHISLLPIERGEEFVELVLTILPVGSGVGIP